MIESISEYIDHTNLRQEANKADIENLCKEAIENNFASVCINPVFVRYASEILNKEIPIYGRPYFFQFLEKFLMKKKGYDLPLI